jgi:hypothetical protein
MARPCQSLLTIIVTKSHVGITRLLPKHPNYHSNKVARGNHTISAKASQLSALPSPTPRAWRQTNDCATTAAVVWQCTFLITHSQAVESPGSVFHDFAAEADRGRTGQLVSQNRGRLGNYISISNRCNDAILTSAIASDRLLSAPSSLSLCVCI